MTDAPAITIPRMPDETTRAYNARVAYLTLGAARSIPRVREKLGKSTASYDRQLEVWSSKYGWVESARRYDEQIAGIAMAAQADEYREMLIAHRDDAMRYGQALCAVASMMLVELRNRVGTLEYTPATLAAITRGLLTGMDLRAHSLQIDELLPRLTPTDEDEPGP